MPEKRFCAVGLAAAALFLVSCGKVPETVVSTAETAALPELKIASSIDRPFFYMGEDGHYTGIDKEIADEACRRMGRTPVYTIFTWGQQDDLLADGTVDCVWDSFAMNGREDMYQWAGPYMTDDEMVLVAADSDIYTLDDLAGRTLAVRIASKGEDYFLKESGMAILRDARTELCTFDTMTDSFSYFGKGYADAVISHGMSLSAMTQDDPNLYRLLDEPLMQLQLGVAFAKDYDTEQISTLRQTLQEMKEDGTIEAIIQRCKGGEAGAANGL